MKRYIPQLDGLRAVAVLLVIGVHTGFIPGGYVGVDIFFVLSGYLITTILIRQRAEGNWSIKRFYARRARRLYPALILLLLVSLPFATRLAPTRHQYLADVLVTGSYLSDFAIAHKFAWLSGLSHTWSLAVEEQFYLLWPFAVVLLVRLGTRKRWALLAAAALAAFGCLALGGASMMVLPFGRGIGLVLGSMLAFALEGRKWPFNPTVSAAISGALLAVVIVIAPIPYGNGLYLISVAAALASVGVIGSIVTGGALAGLLALRPLTWLGERSYGIYLWHFPLLYALEQTSAFRTLYPLDPGHPQPRALIAVLVLSTLLAALSYRFVESRFRQPARKAGRPVPASEGRKSFDGRAVISLADVAELDS